MKGEVSIMARKNFTVGVSDLCATLYTLRDVQQSAAVLQSGNIILCIRHIEYYTLYSIHCIQYIVYTIHCTVYTVGFGVVLEFWDQK